MQSDVTMDTREDFKRTTLRLPTDLYDRLERAAGKAKSVNAVIIEALLEKYPAPPDPMDSALGRVLIFLHKLRPEDRQQFMDAINRNLEAFDAEERLALQAAFQAAKDAADKASSSPDAPDDTQKKRR